MHCLTISDYLNESGQIWAGVWQCYNCGEIVDSLILQNRENMPPPNVGKARLKTFSPFKKIQKEVQRVEF